MGMTIDDSIRYIKGLRDAGGCGYQQANIAISTMRKYQKLEDIYYHQTGQALENSLRAVIEDGKID